MTNTRKSALGDVAAAAIAITASGAPDTPGDEPAALAMPELSEREREIIEIIKRDIFAVVSEDEIAELIAADIVKICAIDPAPPPGMVAVSITSRGKNYY